MGSAKRILVGWADALAAPEVCWSLQEAGYQVSALVACGTDPPLTRKGGISGVRMDVFRDDPTGSITELQRLVNAEQFDALMPLDDYSLWLFNQVRLPHTMVAIMPKASASEVSLNKEYQCQYAQDADFRVPDYVVIKKISDLDNVHFFPCIVKPVHAVIRSESHLSKGSFAFCDTRAELMQLKDRSMFRTPYLAQRYIPGVGCGVFGVSSERGIMALSAHERIRMMNPAGSGSSVCCSRPVPGELISPIEKFFKLIDYRGIFMIELLKDESRNYWFVELNGRSWGSMALARRAGAEYPAWIADYHLGKRDLDLPKILEASDLYCRHLGREIIHFLMVMRGARGNKVIGWPKRWSTLKQVLTPYKNQFWYNRNSKYPGYWMADAIDTVKHKIIR